MKSLSQEKAEFLGVLAGRIVPEFSDLDAVRKARFFALVDEALQDRPTGVRGQFGSFLGLLRWAPLLRFGGSFERLSEGRQDGVLRWFEDCPVSLLRKGFWGLKVLVFMGYYGQAESWETVGYAPEFDGRAGLHA